MLTSTIADLRVDRAVVGGEVRDRAFRRGARVADEARAEVDRRVPRVLAVAEALAFLDQPVCDLEGDRDVRMPTRLGCRGQCRVGDDRRVRLRLLSREQQREPEQDERQRRSGPRLITRDGAHFPALPWSVRRASCLAALAVPMPFRCFLCFCLAAATLPPEPRRPRCRPRSPRGGWLEAPWHSSAAAHGGAGGGRREAAAGAGVVELEEEPVVVLTDQRVVGREVDVGAVGADSRRGPARRRGEDARPAPGVAGPERDQLRPALDVLVDVLGAVGVGVDQRRLRW